MQREHDSYMNKARTRAFTARRAVAVAAVLAVTGGVAVYGGIAGASPPPTVGQVQAKINHLTSQFDRVSVQLDQASQQLSAAQSRLSQVRADLNHADAQFRTAQATVAQNAQTRQLLTDASELAGVEQQVQRTEDGVAALKSQLAAQKNSLGGLITTEKATLASLTVPQQETVATNSIGAD